MCTDMIMNPHGWASVTLSRSGIGKPLIAGRWESSYPLPCPAWNMGEYGDTSHNQGMPGRVASRAWHMSVRRGGVGLRSSAAAPLMQCEPGSFLQRS